MEFPIQEIPSQEDLANIEEDWFLLKVGLHYF